MSLWTKAYEQKCGSATINYQGGGSGKGVTQFEQGNIDFAGSDFALASKDQPLADARCGNGNKAINLPMAPGPIAVGYNVPNLTAPLNLSAHTLAKIFAGTIVNWNDPAIAADNPGVNLPNLPIQTFHRSDGSGTSYNFSAYLANEAKADFPFDANKNWPAPGGQGSNGTQGVAQGVQSTPGGIGYMELSWAKKSGISYANVGNAAGKFVPLTTQNVKNFVGKANIVGTGNDLKLQFDYSNGDPDAYPALLVTYEIVCASGNKSGQLSLLKSFLGYSASAEGQAPLEAAGYVPLPDELRGKIADAVNGLS
jgi:phosphate transport system substrate-binding protein